MPAIQKDTNNRWVWYFPQDRILFNACNRPVSAIIFFSVEPLLLPISETNQCVEGESVAQWDEFSSLLSCRSLNNFNNFGKLQTFSATWNIWRPRYPTERHQGVLKVCCFSYNWSWACFDHRTWLLVNTLCLFEQLQPHPTFLPLPKHSFVLARNSGRENSLTSVQL